MPPRHIGSAILLRSAITCAVACLSSTSLVHAQISLTLTPSDYNGYNISCFGGADGAIDLSVSGGTPPYSYDWSTGATTQDISELRGGYVSVVVRDSQNGQGREELTLTEPNDLQTDAVPYQYASGFNISCVSCFNGSIAVTTTEGVPPYSYDWGDGTTTEDRTQLDAGTYQVYITDANGCVLKGPPLFLTQPERDDWGKSGNAGTDPSTQFIGTMDNKDVVFKSNNVERLRIGSDGDLKVGSLAATGDRLVYVDHNGVLKRHNWGLDGQMSIIPWYLGGNNDVTTSLNRIGPTNAVDFITMTDNTERMRVTATGLVAIGAAQPIDQFEIHTGLARSGIKLNNTRSDDNAHTEIRFMKQDSGRWALGCDFGGNGGQDFFLWDHVAGANRLRVDAAGRVLIGDAVAQSSTLYKLYVEGGIVSRDVKVTANNFPDYVFAKNYALMPLDEVARFIDAHGHLPNMPSAKEVQDNQGVEVGDLQLRLLKTVEEQQLYIKQLHEELSALKSRVTELEKR